MPHRCRWCWRCSTPDSRDNVLLASDFALPNETRASGGPGYGKDADALRAAAAGGGAWTTRCCRASRPTTPAGSWRSSRWRISHEICSAGVHPAACVRSGKRAVRRGRRRVAHLRRRPGQHQVLPARIRSTNPTSTTWRSAWRWRSADGALDLDALRQQHPTVSPRNFKATPLMVGGVLYITTAMHQVAAIDAGHGRSAVGPRPAGLPGQPVAARQRRPCLQQPRPGLLDRRRRRAPAVGNQRGLPARRRRPHGGAGPVVRHQRPRGSHGRIPRAVRGTADFRGNSWIGVASPPIVRATWWSRRR